MSDHAMLALILTTGFVAQLGGLVLLGLQLRDSRRMTRAVGALVVQETEKIRALLGGRT